MKHFGFHWLCFTVALFPAVAGAQLQAERAPAPSQLREERRGAAYIAPENIRETERVLQAQGFKPGAVDGVMDQDTVNAIRAFQQREGLRMTGVLNPVTIARLKNKGGAFPSNLADSAPGMRSPDAQR
jgi:peptidoglycan hydrolase-like protein with peptidoglycan-binding domain